MTWIWTLQSKTGEALVTAARNSQALVIGTMDRVAGVSERRELPLWNRVVRFQLEFVSLMLDDPAQIVDDGYEVLERLIALHREFAQRLFEVVDPREPSPTVTSDATTGDVLEFPTKRAYQATR